MKKFQLFDQNHRLSPLQKCQFWLLLKYMFILSKNACFLTRTSPSTFYACILHKAKGKLASTGNIVIDDDTEIQELDQEGVYK